MLHVTSAVISFLTLLIGQSLIAAAELGGALLAAAAGCTLLLRIALRRRR